jgi:hydrogenase expression/formation protein HypC
MCLAVPGKIIGFVDNVESVFKIGKVSFDGIIKKINLGLVPEAIVGDYVLVHVGVAMSVVDEAEAKRTMDFLLGTDDLEDIRPDDE